MSEPRVAHTKPLNPYGINERSVVTQKTNLSRFAHFGRVCSLRSIASGPFEVHLIANKLS